MAAAPIYLDHQATTPCDPAVVQAMAPWWSDAFANPSSRSHRPGLEAAAQLLGACPDIKLVLNDANFSPSGRRFGSYYG